MFKFPKESKEEHICHTKKGKKIVSEPVRKENIASSCREKIKKKIQVKSKSEGKKKVSLV